MPYWRLSNFYFFYFALLGAIAPYAPLYFAHLGFSPARIGELVAMPMLMRCLAPNLWGWLGDKTGQRLRIIRWGALLTLLGFSLIFINKSYAWLALVMLIHAFFWHAILPQFEVITFEHLSQRPQDYSRIRLWGSVGFIVTVVLLGYVFADLGLGSFPWLVCLIMLGIWLSSLLVPRAKTQAARLQSQVGYGFFSYLQQRPIGVFYLAVMLMQISHGPYYTFLSVYLTELGYSRSAVGWLWSLGVLAEIGLFIYMPKLLLRFSLRHVLLASFALAAVRWLALGYLADQLLCLIVIQILHAATFGSFHAAAMQFVQRQFPSNRQGQGQALYVSLSGVGAAIGALYAGYMWSAAGAAGTFAVAAGAATMALIIVWMGLTEHRNGQTA